MWVKAMIKAIISFAAIVSLLLSALNSTGTKSAANIFHEKGDVSSGVSAKGYVLIEAVSGGIVSKNNQDKPLPVASTTKIMTALITLEQPNLQEYFTVDSEAIKVEGTSMGLTLGAKVNLQALAVGMLLCSGNDAANAAAVRIAGSIQEFAVMMNEKAAELGMKNTHFVTPSGLHDINHYSTAFDMAILARHALKNTHFSAICASEKMSVEIGNPIEKRVYTNHNKLLTEYEGCIGVKTGFTKAAGRCLVSAVNRDNITLICVTLGASDDWNAHKLLYDYGFSTVTPVEIAMEQSNVAVVGGESEAVFVQPSGAIRANIKAGDEKKLVQQVFTDRFYYAPIKKDDIMGEVRYYLNGNEVASAPLVAASDVGIAPKKSKISRKSR